MAQTAADELHSHHAGLARGLHLQQGLTAFHHFLAALALAPQSARNTLAGYDAKNRNAITYRLAAAKQPETRAKRIEEFIARLTRGERFH